VLLRSLMRRRWIYPIFPLVLCLLFSFSFWGRVPFVMAMIIFASCKLILSLIITSQNNLKQNTIKYTVKTIIIIFIIIIAMFSFLSWTIEFRISQYGPRYNPTQQYASDNLIAKYLQNHSSLFASYRAAQITWSYLVSPIATFDYWVSQDSEYALGQASFPYFFRLAHKLGLSKEPEIVGDRPLGGGLQLPTFLGYAYIDFGFFGIFLYSFILGYVATRLYRNLFRRPRLSSYMYLSLIYILILLSPQISATTWTMFPMFLLGMWGVSLLIRLKFHII